MIIIIILIIALSIIIIKKHVSKRLNDKEEVKVNLLEEFFVVMGASYDEKQDIVYSKIDSWQRKYGYCKLYDNLAWLVYMAIDCEPIYFEYDEKMWLIEFWKGQYVIATGCEIGLYVSDELNLKPQDIFFNSVDDDNMIEMEFVLKRGKEVLFQRKERSWWLTGFRFGEFSKPKKLSMDIILTFNDRLMLEAFRNSLNSIGYKNVNVNDNSISFEYNKPKTKRYLYRKILDSFIQVINRIMCKRYNNIVKKVSSIKGKFEVVKRYSLKIYIKIIKAILMRKLIYKKIKK